MPGPKTQHILRDVDPVSRTGVCHVCGPTKVYRRAQNRWRCATAHTTIKRRNRQAKQSLARSSLKALTPCCRVLRILPPLEHPNATAAQSQFTVVECRCERVYMVIRLHQPAEDLGPDPGGRLGTQDQLVWAAAFAYFVDGERDTDVAIEVDGNPSMSGVLDAPRLRAALLKLAYNDDAADSWWNSSNWELVDGPSETYDHEDDNPMEA